MAVLTIRIPSLRSIALIMLGLALGATLVSNVLARDTTVAGVEPAAIQTRAVSCPAYGFVWIRDGVAYGHSHNARASGGDQWFVCNANLPHPSGGHEGLLHALRRDALRRGARLRPVPRRPWRPLQSDRGGAFVHQVSCTKCLRVDKSGSRLLFSANPSRGRRNGMRRFRCGSD
jgi:hypothetical protein